MEWYNSIGDMLKWFIKVVRNKTLKETALAMDIKYTTFAEQLKNNTVTAETLFRLAAYLDIDLNWMMMMLGHHGKVSGLKNVKMPRMGNDLRALERERVLRRLDVLIMENPNSTPDTRRELLKEFGKNMFYLLDVLTAEEHALFMISERGKIKYYVEAPSPNSNPRVSFMSRKRENVLYEGSQALDIIIEERKDNL